MTLTKIKTLMAAAMAATILVPMAPAMTDERLKVQLTESVWCGGTKLEPGAYTISMLPMSSDQPVLSVTSAGGLTVLTPAMRAKHNTRSDKTEVVLRREGSETRLSEIRFGGHFYSYELFPLVAR